MNACLQLARDLRDNKSHAVVFFGLKDSDSCIRANGFNFRVVFESHFPEGYFSDDLSIKGLWGTWRKLRA
ncbi:MAG: hypothetical protein ACRERS_09130, partial [Methylococcales bacterium]